MKLALVLYTAMLVAQDPKRVRDLKSMSNPLLLRDRRRRAADRLQPDLGTDLVICSTLGMLLIAAGARIQDLAKVAAALAVVVLIIEPARAVPNGANHIVPESRTHDPTGSGYQIEQARIAIGSGGFFGVGLGESVQKVFYMPEAHTDMILAVIGEELGLLGICVLVTLYTGADVRADCAPPRTAATSTRGCWRSASPRCSPAQALLNFFAVLGMAPLTGVPLPFISYGGANLIVMLVRDGSADQRRLRPAHGARARDPRWRQSEPSHQRPATGTAQGRERPPQDRERRRRPRGGHNENRRRGRGNGRTRRSGPGSR